MFIRKADAITEYIIVAGAFVLSLSLLGTYLKRGVQNKVKQLSDAELGSELRHSHQGEDKPITLNTLSDTENIHEEQRGTTEYRRRIGTETQEEVDVNLEGLGLDDSYRREES